MPSLRARKAKASVRRNSASSAPLAARNGTQSVMTKRPRLRAATMSLKPRASVAISLSSAASPVPASANQRRTSARASSRDARAPSRAPRARRASASTIAAFWHQARPCKVAAPR